MVGVADHTDIVVFVADLLDQFVLDKVRILKFIHHHVNVSFLIAGKYFRVLAE